MQMASQPMRQLTSLFQQGTQPVESGWQGINADAGLQFGSLDQLGMYGTARSDPAAEPTGVPGCFLARRWGASMPLRPPDGRRRWRPRRR